MGSKGKDRSCLQNPDQVPRARLALEGVPALLPLLGTVGGTLGQIGRPLHTAIAKGAGEGPRGRCWGLLSEDGHRESDHGEKKAS